MDQDAIFYDWSSETLGLTNSQSFTNALLTTPPIRDDAVELGQFGDDAFTVDSLQEVLDYPDIDQSGDEEPNTFARSVGGNGASRIIKHSTVFTLGGSSSESEQSDDETSGNSQNLVTPSTARFCHGDIPVNAAYTHCVCEKNKVSCEQHRDEDGLGFWGIGSSPSLLQARRKSGASLVRQRSLLSTLVEEPDFTKVLDGYELLSAFAESTSGPQVLMNPTSMHHLDHGFEPHRDNRSGSARVFNTPGNQEIVSRHPTELFIDQSCGNNSDSDCSWTEADDQQEWYLQLQAQLSAFREQNSRLSLITSPLSKPQRKQVHALAKLMRLSHMSLGSGRHKRLLLSKCELAQAASGCPGSRRWNSKQTWVLGWTDPRLVAIENISWDVPQSQVMSSLVMQGVTAPRKFALLQQTHTGNFAAYAFFAAADDASAAMLALHGTKPLWNRCVLSCELLRLPGRSRVIDESVLDLAKLARASAHLWLAEQDCSDLPLYEDETSLRANSTWPDDGRPISAYCTPHIGEPSNSGNHSVIASTLSPDCLSLTKSTSSHSIRSPDSEGPILTGKPLTEATTSMTSIVSFMPSEYGSDTSTAKKRKRQPYTEAGFRCSHCQKSFDRAGDRRKHEKVHNVDRPHRCEPCGVAFLYPKDLRRHQMRKRHFVQSNAGDMEETALTRSLSCNDL